MKQSRYFFALISINLLTIHADERSSLLQTDVIPYLIEQDLASQIREADLLLSETAIPQASALDEAIAYLFWLNPHEGINPQGSLIKRITEGLLPYLQSAFNNSMLFDTIKQVACGENHTVILTENGAVYAVGDNTYGQLGIGESGGFRSTFTLMVGEGTSGVTAIAAGGWHTVVLKGDKAYATGNNSSGQLGTSAGDKHQLTLLETPGNSGVTAIAAGDYHTIALKGDMAYATGNNSRGQLGLEGGNKSILTPMALPGDTAIIAITAGNFHTAVIKNGSAYATGDNTYGQLGLGLAITMTTVLTPMASPGDTDISLVVAGQDFTLALKNGAAYGTGRNNAQQLGTAQAGDKDILTIMANPGDADITALAAGDFHTIALKNGVAYATGANNYGQLGTTSGDKSILTQLERPGNERVSAIAAGANFTFALKNGAVYATGENSVGQLGTSSGDKDVLTEITGEIRGIYNFNQ